ncbi:MAG TPA: HypC/HybG/HupF family hydrogenase formation chaperone [Nitrososphaerales archaeon]|nr:HypC/HybG/HupF family hydrogenase formation chaperone [Nitrososphaerales archaeon]
MCVTRAGKVISASRGRARVEFFDGRALDDVDLCVVNAQKGDFVEVFGNLALSVLTPSEARGKKKAWAEVRKAAMRTPAGAL